MPENFDPTARRNQCLLTQRWQALRDLYPPSAPKICCTLASDPRDTTPLATVRYGTEVSQPLICLCSVTLSIQDARALRDWLTQWVGHPDYAY